MPVTSLLRLTGEMLPGRALDIEEVLSGAVDSDIHLFVACVTESSDIVDRGVLDRVLSSLGLPGWFRHAYFEYHAPVGLLFKLAAGLEEPWTRDGSIPQGCPLSTPAVGIFLFWRVLSLFCMLINSIVYAGTLLCFYALPGSRLGMSGWLVRSLLLGSVSL